jgi:haloalkane dehalogenase
VITSVEADPDEPDDPPRDRPGWLNPALFPFRPNYVTVNDCLIHYVDEGHGMPVLLLHGIPVWSLTYRGLIEQLRPHVRCIAADMPGFGLSVASTDFTYTPADQEDVLAKLVDHLDLEHFVVVGHDWGAPLALRLALRHPDRIAGLVIENGWAWPDHPGARWARIGGGRLLGRAIRSSNAFIRVALRAGGPRLRLDREIERAYCAPHPTPASRRSQSELVYQNGQNALGRSRYLADLEEALGDLRHLPALIVWGARCPVFRAPERERFERSFPRHRTHVLPTAGHFVHEDAPEIVGAAIRLWAADEGLI